MQDTTGDNPTICSILALSSVQSSKWQLPRPRCRNIANETFPHVAESASLIRERLITLSCILKIQPKPRAMLESFHLSHWNWSYSQYFTKCTQASSWEEVDGYKLFHMSTLLVSIMDRLGLSCYRTCLCPIHKQLNRASHSKGFSLEVMQQWPGRETGLVPYADPSLWDPVSYSSCQKSGFEQPQKAEIIF